ncbi:MAG: hypothetical protein QNJ40_26455 [Xanthomonadales bacterium]|nr:hypothetical protein [Xanthomonadales bacterium]
MKVRHIAWLALVLAAGVHAKGEPEPKLTALEGSFAEQKQAIENDIRGGVVYREIEGKDLMTVRTSLEHMSTLLSGVEEVQQLSEDDKVDLLNHQELVNAILTMAEKDSRMVCKRRGSTGSHFKTTTCETVRARRKRQSDDRQRIQSLLRNAATGPQDG